MNDIAKNQKWDFLERPKCEDLDSILGQPIPCLDKGFIRVIDYMGDEAAVVQAARVSYGKGTRSTSEDSGLLRYLMRHWHTTPFEMCEIKVHVKLPIFVARQWIRHRTASVNEYSARYSILANEFYVPDVSVIAAQSKTNKQGREDGTDDLNPETVRQIILEEADRSYTVYEDLVDEEGHNVARELSRMVLPTNIYTEWYWKVNLHNLLHFLRLRMDPHAQYEIRVYADVLARIVSQWVPHVWDAFLDYRLNAHTFSGPEMEAIRDWFEKLHEIDGLGVPPLPVLPLEFNQRERQAFMNAFLKGMPK